MSSVVEMYEQKGKFNVYFGQQNHSRLTTYKTFNSELY